MTSQFPSLQTYSKERPNYRHPSDIAPSGLTPSHPSNHQPHMRSESQNMSPLSVPGHGPSEVNDPIVSGLAPSFESPYLTGPAFEPDLTGNDGVIFSLPSHSLPRHYYGYQTMTPASLMQPSFRTARSSYPDADNHREIPIVVVGGSQRVVPVSNIDPPPYMPPAYPPDGSIPGVHHPTWYANTTSPSESTPVDAPGGSGPTALQFPHVQRTLYRTFIDGSPLLKQAYDVAKETVASPILKQAYDVAKETVASPILKQAYDVAKGTVASHPILKASEARRRNPATFTCEYCQATFTRSHNLSYHRDAHFGIKKHNTLCGKKFGTPSGSKRHQGTCSKCKGASSSLSPG